VSVFSAVLHDGKEQTGVLPDFSTSK